jgi:toll-like receptor 13
MYSKDSLDQIVSQIPNNTEYLQVILATISHGDFPIRNLKLRFAAVAQLKHLKYFHLMTKDYRNIFIFELEITLDEAESFKYLQNLTSIRINIPFVDNNATINSTVRLIPNLKLLDLSSSRKLGKAAIHELLQTMDIPQLCLRKFQVPGGDEYISDFSELWPLCNVTLWNVNELDFSKNALTIFPSGLTKLAPNLKYLDLSYNLLMEVENIAFIVEAFCHNSLEILNLGNQGYEIPNNVPHSEKQLTKEYLLEQKSEPSPAVKSFIFAKYCYNDVSSGNISNFYGSPKRACVLLKCFLGIYFPKYDCNDTFLPALNEVFCLDCYRYIKIPIGRKLRIIDYSSYHNEQSMTFDIISHGILTLKLPNQLEELYCKNNRDWFVSAEAQNLLETFSGFKNFPQIHIIDFSNNAFTGLLGRNWEGVFGTVEMINFAYNYVTLDMICGVFPRLKALNVSHGNLTLLATNIISNCSSLEIFDLSYNKDLNVESLDNISFEGTGNIKRFILSNNNLKHLEKKFLDKVDTFPNMTIDLSSNPFLCDCQRQSQEFITWLHRNGQKNRLIAYNSYYCTGPHGTTFIKDINDVQSFFSMCRDNTQTVVFMSVFSTLGFITFIAAIVLIYKKRWRLKYYIFCFKQYIKYNCFTTNIEKITWKYDAFVSYCAEDRFWVHDTFMKILEHNYGFHLCIHYRDFPVGGFIYDAIVEKMSQSREIILIISDNSLKSEWCSYEIGEALRITRERNQPLIVITIGEITTAYLNAQVTHILDKHTYLVWSEQSGKGNNSRRRLFWKTLLGIMYNNPSGDICSCCCPYGASSLYVDDIHDPLLDEDRQNRHQVFILVIFDSGQCKQ